MIICGYQGIGKSSLGGTDKYIDLESSSFWTNGKRPNDWYIYYCRIAKQLSDQGFIVFVSSHAVVRDYLYENGITALCIVPDISLKDRWIAKLKRRYCITHSEKDYKAQMNAEDRYVQNISEIIDGDLYTHVITDMGYNLSCEVTQACVELTKSSDRR